MSVLNSEDFAMNSTDQTHIIRGKRTRRSRPTTAVTSSSSSGCSSGAEGPTNNYVSVSIVSPMSSDNSACTEEDEDMANCLILLAQSGGCEKRRVQEVKVDKFCSRKFTEMTTTNDGARAGFYVYECKTCNRSFPSFQALGGHRASHKKLKTEEKVIINDHGDEKEDANVKINKLISSVPLSKPAATQQNTQSKVHECSICGSEFSSGQALGGHMRRHRSTPTTNANIDANSVVIDNGDEKNKSRNILQLDLNLPAPEDDHRDSKFQFIFSGPALVGCQY